MIILFCVQGLLWNSSCLSPGFWHSAAHGQSCAGKDQGVGAGAWRHHVGGDEKTSDFVCPGKLPPRQRGQQQLLPFQQKHSQPAVQNKETSWHIPQACTVLGRSCRREKEETKCRCFQQGEDFNGSFVDNLRKYRWECAILNIFKMCYLCWGCSNMISHLEGGG